VFFSPSPLIGSFLPFDTIFQAVLPPPAGFDGLDGAIFPCDPPIAISYSAAPSLPFVLQREPFFSQLCNMRTLPSFRSNSSAAFPTIASPLFPSASTRGNTFPFLLAARTPPAIHSSESRYLFLRTACISFQFISFSLPFSRIFS